MEVQFLFVYFWIYKYGEELRMMIEILRTYFILRELLSQSNFR